MKYSINMTEDMVREPEMSPIKKRMVEDEVRRSQKSGQIARNGHLENVMMVIKHREAELEDRLKEIKERKKSVTFKEKVLEEVQPNQLPQSSSKIQDRFEFYSP